jgi:hypothetical protein
MSVQLWLLTLIFWVQFLVASTAAVSVTPANAVVTTTITYLAIHANTGNRDDLMKAQRAMSATF